MATLYLHIGTHKTGTTAIQKFCDLNRMPLARRGYWFPLSPYKFNRLSIIANGRFLVRPCVDRDGNFENPREAAIWHKRLARVVGCFRRYPNIILSDELFWNNSSFSCKGLWKNLKREADAGGFDVRIIVYFRRQDQFISSLWAQRVKGLTTKHGKMPWEEALAQAEDWIELDYYRHLEEIAEFFGRDAINVRIYDRKRFPGGDIVPDFLSAIGLTMEDEYQLPDQDSNISIGGNSLEIKRIVNNVPGIRDKQIQQVRQAVEACWRIEREKASYSLFSDEELRDFLARYEQGNRLLARDYLGEGEESPFPPPEPQRPKWTPENSYMYETYKNFLELYLQPHRHERIAWPKRFLERNWRRLRQLLFGACKSRPK